MQAAHSGLLTFLFDSVVAVFYTAAFHYPFIASFVYSQCIGLSCFLISAVLESRWGLEAMRWRVPVIAIPAGTVVGIGIASSAFGLQAVESSGGAVATMIGAFMFGAAIAYYFYAHFSMVAARGPSRG